METLNFTKVGDEWISDPISGSPSVVVHINFVAPTAIYVDRTMDKDRLGWSKFTGLRVPENYEDTITGIPQGVAVRIRTPRKPVIAEYKTL